MGLTNTQIEVVKDLYTIQYKKYLKAKQYYNKNAGNRDIFIEYYTTFNVISHLAETLSVIGFDIETLETHIEKEFRKELKQLEQN